MDILDKIDDVITWHGSRDAMVWTVEPPKWPSLHVDPEAAQRLLDHLAQVVEQVRPALQQAVRAFGEIGRALSAAVPHLVTMQTDIDAARRSTRRRMKIEYDRRRSQRRR